MEERSTRAEQLPQRGQLDSVGSRLCGEQGIAPADKINRPPWVGGVGGLGPAPVGVQPRQKMGSTPFHIIKTSSNIKAVFFRCDTWCSKYCLLSC